MIRETIVPAIPDVRADNVAEVLRAIKSTIDVREGSIGDPLDQAVTLRELAALNVVESGGTTATSFGRSLPVVPVLPPLVNGYNPATDLTTPPAPSNLRARGGFTNVYLEWDGAPYRNHGYTEIWRSQTDNLGTAVMVGTTAASVYGDPVSPDTTYFYWIRFVSSAAIVGPYNSTSGTQATTAIDVSAALATITNDIASSQLFIDLGTRVKAIEVQSVLTSSELSVLREARAQFDAQIARNGSAILTTQKITATQATLITQLGTRVGSAESNITSLQSTTATQATQLTSLTTRVGTSESNITTLQSTTATQAGQISTLTSSVGGNTTSIQTLTTTTNGLSGQYTVKIDNNGHVSGFGLASTTTTAGPTSAFIVRADRFAIAGASDTTDPLGTLTPTKMPFVVLTTPTTIGGKTYPAGTWIDTAFIANATIGTAQISDLTADKITAGSVTAALGLSTGKIFGGVAISTNTTDGTYGQLLYPFASNNFGTGFFLGLDSSVYKFYVGSPTQNMNWNGSALTVTGNINATSGSFRNITIYDSSNNVILSSGGVNTSLLGLGGLAYQNSVTTGQVSGLGTLATQNYVTTGQVSGLGTLATQNTVSTGQVTGLGGLATQNSVFVGSTVKFSDGSTMNTSDFVNRLSQINAVNISTFIASAAIGDAYIGNLNASKITAGTIAADRLSSTIITGKVANLDAANILDGTITTAKIGNLQVDTVKIKDNAVTVPLVSRKYTEVYPSSLDDGYGNLINSGEIMSYTFTMPSAGKAIIMWQAETDSTKWCYWTMYLNGVEIGYNRAGGAFQDAPICVGEGNVSAGSNTVSIRWSYNRNNTGIPGNGWMVEQILVVFGAQK